MESVIGRDEVDPRTCVAEATDDIEALIQIGVYRRGFVPQLDQRAISLGFG